MDAEDSEEEEDFSFSQTFTLFKDIVKNKNLQLWFAFILACKSAAAINGNLTQVYLTNDLSYPKEDLAFIRLCCMPGSLIVAVLAGYLT
jgi:hypothetical protein